MSSVILHFDRSRPEPPLIPFLLPALTHQSNNMWRNTTTRLTKNLRQPLRRHNPRSLASAARSSSSPQQQQAAPPHDLVKAAIQKMLLQQQSSAAVSLESLEKASHCLRVRSCRSCVRVPHVLSFLDALTPSRRHLFYNHLSLHLLHNRGTNSINWTRSRPA